MLVNCNVVIGANPRERSPFDTPSHSAWSESRVGIPGTRSSNIWRMPISQTVVMRSGSDYRSLSLVHGRKSVISKFDPLEKILRGRWGSGVGVIRYEPEGYILPPEKNFPGRPLKICGTYENYAKNDPQQWSYLGARAPAPLTVTP